MLLRYFSFLLICLLPACSRYTVLKPFIPSIEDKREWVRAGEVRWQGSGSPRTFGRARSHQLLEADKLKITDSSLSYDGGSGMGCVITADGYTLTATHVIDDVKHSGILMADDSHVRVHVTTTLFKKNEEKKWRRLGQNLSIYPQKGKSLKHMDLKGPGALRVVHRFPGQDLALVKLPASQAPYFQMTEPPGVGEWIFSSGSGASMSPGSTAGRIVEYDRKLRELMTTMPGTPGDSGSPVFDARGRLIGILSDMTFKGEGVFLKKGLRVFQKSVVQVPDIALVKQLIAADRRKYRSR